jgi:hypothetical protein
MQVIIQGMLGHGSWGNVYAGKWRGLPIALKTLVFMAADKQPQEGSAAADEHTHGRGSLHVHGNTRVLPGQQAITEAAVAVSVCHRNVVSDVLLLYL